MDGEMDTVIGVVAHQTGRLAALGAPLRFAAEAYRLGAGTDRFPVSIRDSASTPAGADDAVRRLVEEDGAALVVTLGGTHTVPAVALAGRRLGVPCLSTTLPWQVYRSKAGVGGYHACWGLDDIADAFADLWARVPDADSVGCLWNSGPQGAALRARDSGFATAAADRGLRLVDPGGYAEDQADFHREVAALRGVRIVTSAATARDLRMFGERAAAERLELDLITCSRWLSYPVGAQESGVDGVATPVYWSPRHPYRSSLDGLTCAELAVDYQRGTGQAWLQPLGMAYALFEVAHRVLGVARGSAEIAAELDRTRLATIAGTLDWTTGPAKGVARVRLASGQWQRGDTGTAELNVVANDRVPEVPVTAELRLAVH
ncbi:MAG TPA: ABC transporter substrate-binding protein [Pseudonocardiaceae bacterium]|jgi:branched-chain amino acid transport system substrate-binding protein|nr:ABC transporter substrate-binding protein [Pseudonocardiaceae bacterium]